MYQSKRKDVQTMKEQIDELRRKKTQDEQVDLQAKRVKMETVRCMQEQSQKTYLDFLATKKGKFKDEFKSKIDEEKQLIYQLEQEA